MCSACRDIATDSLPSRLVLGITNASHSFVTPWIARAPRPKFVDEFYAAAGHGSNTTTTRLVKTKISRGRRCLLWPVRVARSSASPCGHPSHGAGLQAQCRKVSPMSLVLPRRRPRLGAVEISRLCRRGGDAPASAWARR